jgi:hypothetical protein
MIFVAIVATRSSITPCVATGCLADYWLAGCGPFVVLAGEELLFKWIQYKHEACGKDELTIGRTCYTPDDKPQVC